jgi:DNA-binding NarL/FixJ family response regulator
VILADDHVVFTDGLVSLLKGRFEIVGVVDDGHLLLEAVARLEPDVIVTDVSMRTMSGFEALRRLKVQVPQSRVVLLTMHADPHLAVEALQSGASGFVLKESTGAELVTAIDEALQGRTYLSPAITGDVLALLSEPAGSEVQLTVRQREVIRLVAEGRRMKEIAASLDISTRTAETIKYDVMRTLNLHSTADLVRYAIQHHLVPL